MIKLYYNLSTYQFIGKVTGGETWVQGDDDSKTLAIYFGSGADVASFVNGLTSTTIYNQTCTVNVTRPDESTASLSATAIVSGTDIYYKLIIDGWVCEQAGTIEIEPQLITATTTTAYGQATQAVAEGTSGSEETITETQYNTLIANYNTLNSIKLNKVLKGYYKSSEFSLSGTMTTAEYVEAVYAALIDAEGDYAFDSVANIMNDSVTISDLPSGASDCLLTLQTEDVSGTQAKRGFVIARGTVASDYAYYGIINSDSDSGFSGWKRYLNDDDLTTLNAAIDAIEDGSQDITYDNAVSGLVAVTLKAAIDELSTAIDDLNDEVDANDTDISNLQSAVALRELLSNKIIAWGSPTDDQYPSAKLTKDSLDLKEDAANKGATNGYAPLVGGLIPAAYIPGGFDNYEEVATYADLPEEGSDSVLYIVIADETSGGNASTYRWATSVYVKVSEVMSASEVKTLYESNADTNAFTDALKTKLTDIYTKAQLDTLFGDRYTKAEVDALLDSLKAIYGWQSSALANDVASAATVNNSIWADYDMILLVATNGTNTYTTIARVADLIDGDTFTVGSGTFVIGATTSTFTYSGYTLDITGIKMDGTVHNEMRSVGSETITYREDGKISSVVADTITTTPTYDEYGNVTKITEVYALDGKTYETTFTYDKFGRISATNKVEV
jgi:endonuclease YncB( thermonuclease family)